MCYDSTARPPDPPGERGEANGQDLVLTSADGTQFAAYLAQPKTKAMAQVLIYPDVRGLHQFYKELALRFAEVGTGVIVIDYFGRTAGLTPRDDSFEYMPHVQQLNFQNVLQDAKAGFAEIRKTMPDAKIFVLGFCMGGGLVLRTGTQDLGLNGGVAFYAGLSRPMAGAEGTVLEGASKVRIPILGLFGGADQGIPVAQVEELDLQLDKANVDHELVIYPEAPHSFFDRHQTTYADQSEDAWARVIEFLEENSEQQ